MKRLLKFLTDKWNALEAKAIKVKMERLIEVTGIGKFDKSIWGIELAERVWEKAVQEKPKGDFRKLIAYMHKYYCGQGLFWLTKAETWDIGLELKGDGLGIFIVNDMYPSKTLFLWSSREAFIRDFSRLSDFGLAGGSDDSLYDALPKDRFHLGNQTLTKNRVERWLNGDEDA